jgi:hypothetical protein
MDIDTIARGLQQPGAYPHATAASITVIRTAVSLVFLTGQFAYKVNKPVNLGFLDFSTLEKRKKQCQDELTYNKLISPELYLDVVTITDDDGQLTINGNGTVVEYALKMKQVDPHATMDRALQRNMVTEHHIKKMAEMVAAFHARAPTDEEITSFGSVAQIMFNWQENFDQTVNYVPHVIAEEDFSLIKRIIFTFIERHKELFAQRMNKGKIKHCHGDLHSGNVFIIGEKIYFFDGIVFNKRFPCCDVIAEIAYMAMDLDYHGREDFATLFVDRYAHITQDGDIDRLLNFYKSYRAYIRAKIHCFTSDDYSLSPEEKARHIQRTQRYIQLAKRYAHLL